MREALGQRFRFLLVGGAGYGLNLLVFAGLIAVSVSYVAASIVAYVVTNALMYLGNRYFTFRLGHEGFWAAYGRYLLVGLVVVALNAAVLVVLVEGLALDETLGQALSLLLVTPAAFVMFKRWTFRLRSA